MIYTKLLDLADIQIAVHPTDRGGISFQRKAVKPMQANQ
jgi:hypothetical protein